jgi:hypothetical protein
MHNKVLRILTNAIIDNKGFILESGLCFLVSKSFSMKYSTNPLETELIYVDNGGDFVEDFSQHEVLKIYIIEKSIEL